MKFIFKPAGYHFRNRINPDTKSHFAMLISRNYASVPTYKVIEKLRKLLFSRAATFSSPNTFTLLNITSLMSGISYGYTPEPTNVLKFNNTIAFTFAIRQDSSLTYSGTPTHIQKENNEITFWGYQHPKEYVTIAIEMADILEQGLAIKDYEYLYLIIGSVTKNFAIFKDVDSYSMAVDRNSITQNFQSIFNLDLASLFYSVPYRNWVYCKAVWASCPEILSASHITPYSALYYAVFLSSKTLTTKYNSRLDSVKHLLNELYKYYLQSQRMLISNQVGETSIDDEHDYIVSFIYPASVYCIFHMLNVPLSSTGGTGYREWKPKARLSNFYEWLGAMTVKMQEDLYLHTDIQFLAQMPTLCKDAILNKMSTFRKAAVILSGQSAHEFFTQK